MKQHDPLDRLFKNAALAKREEASPQVGFPVQARIFAAWRSAREESEAFLPLLRKAILAAATVTIVAVAVTLMTANTSQQAELDEMVAATNYVNEAVEIVWNP